MSHEINKYETLLKLEDPFCVCYKFCIVHLLSCSPEQLSFHPMFHFPLASLGPIYKELFIYFGKVLLRQGLIKAFILQHFNLINHFKQKSESVQFKV